MPLGSTTTCVRSSWSSGTASTCLCSCSRVAIAQILAPGGDCSPAVRPLGVPFRVHPAVHQMVDSTVLCLPLVVRSAERAADAARSLCWTARASARTKARDGDTCQPEVQDCGIAHLGMGGSGMGWHGPVSQALLWSAQCPACTRKGEGLLGSPEGVRAARPSSLSAVTSHHSLQPHHQAETHNQLSTHPQARASGRSAPQGVSMLPLTSGCRAAAPACALQGAPPCAGAVSATECDSYVASVDTHGIGRATLALTSFPAPATLHGLPACAGAASAPFRVSAATPSQCDGVQARRVLRSLSAREACIADGLFSARQACLHRGCFIPATSHPQGPPAGVRSAPLVPLYGVQGVSMLPLTSLPPCAGAASATECDSSVASADTYWIGRAQLARVCWRSQCTGLPAPATGRGLPAGAPNWGAPFRVSAATPSHRDGVHTRRVLRSLSAREACIADGLFSARQACLHRGCFIPATSHPQGPPAGVRSAPLVPLYGVQGVSMLPLTSLPPCAGAASATECDSSVASADTYWIGRAQLARVCWRSQCTGLPAPATGRVLPAGAPNWGAPFRVFAATPSHRDGVHTRHVFHSTPARAACIQDVSTGTPKACIPDGPSSAPARCIEDGFSAREACLSSTHETVRACLQGPPAEARSAHGGLLSSPPACLPACAGAASASTPKECAAPRLRPFMGWRHAEHVGGGALAQPACAQERCAASRMGVCPGAARSAAYGYAPLVPPKCPARGIYEVPRMGYGVHGVWGGGAQGAPYGYISPTPMMERA